MSRLANDAIVIRGREDDSPAGRFRRTARKSALLNAVIVLTSFPVLVVAGGPGAVIPAVVVMGAISMMIWTATFALYSCASVGRLVWRIGARNANRKPPVARRADGVADRWLDGAG